MPFFEKIKDSSGKRKFLIWGFPVFVYIKKSKKIIHANLKDNEVRVPSNCDFILKIKGKGNQILLPKNAKGKFDISINGNNNKVIIESDNYINLIATLGVFDTPTENCVVKIGKNTSINGLSIILSEKNSSVSIGERCLFSTNVQIWGSDTHSVLDEKNNLINYGKKVKIWNHVWVGLDTRILKNTTIPNNSIVGMGTIICKNFTEENCAIAGNPAKIIKRNINWDSNRPDVYLKNKK